MPMPTPTSETTFMNHISWLKANGVPTIKTMRRAVVQRKTDRGNTKKKDIWGQISLIFRSIRYIGVQSH
jgi:hypothetical protein